MAQSTGEESPADRTRALATIAVALALAGCGQNHASQPSHVAASGAPAAVVAGAAAVTPSPGGAPSPGDVQMGRAKSVTTFFVTSAGRGDGGNLGGLAGADAHCQTLAEAAGAGDHSFRAYLSTSATAAGPVVNARDRIGTGPWHNADGFLIAGSVADLHGALSNLDKDNAESEDANPVNAEDGPNRHEILTGSQADGTAFPAGSDLTCGNWTSDGTGHAEVGHYDRAGDGSNGASWNAAAVTRGCGQADLQATGGAGLFYCFAIN